MARMVAMRYNILQLAVAIWTNFDWSKSSHHVLDDCASSGMVHPLSLHSRWSNWQVSYAAGEILYGSFSNLFGKLLRRMRHLRKPHLRSKHDEYAHCEQYDQQQEPRLSRMQTAERRWPRRRRFIRLSSLQTVSEASRKGSNVLGRLWYVGSSKRIML